MELPLLQIYIHTYMCIYVWLGKGHLAPLYVWNLTEHYTYYLYLLLLCRICVPLNRDLFQQIQNQCKFFRLWFSLLETLSSPFCSSSWSTWRGSTHPRSNTHDQHGNANNLLMNEWLIGCTDTYIDIDELIGTTNTHGCRYIIAAQIYTSYSMVASVMSSMLIGLIRCSHFIAFGGVSPSL